MLQEKELLKKLSELFKASTLRDFSINGAETLIPFREIFDTLSNKSSNDLSSKSFLDATFNLLSRKYRNEYIYKNFLLSRKLIGTHSLKTSSMLTELRVGKAKADCVMLNGIATCYEIKTERDSLSRLDNQLSEYNGYFDETYVVLSESDIIRYERKIPVEIGIVSLTNRNQFRTIRESSKLCSGYSAEMAINILRAQELREIVYAYDETICDVPNTETVSYCRRVLNSLPESDLKASVLKSLKNRGLVQNLFLTQLPFSLRAAALDFKFTVDQQTKLMINLGKDFRQTEHACTIQSSELSSSN